MAHLLFEHDLPCRPVMVGWRWGAQEKSDGGFVRRATPRVRVRPSQYFWCGTQFVGGMSTRSCRKFGNACVSHTPCESRSPLSIWVRFLGLEQDDLGLQTDHLCEQ